MRAITKIIYHCSANQASSNIGVKEIRAYHTAPVPNGRGWTDIGYHYVIRRNGTIEEGRNEDIAGAHVAGHNKDSIGICLIGGIDRKGNPEDNFTEEQFNSLADLTKRLLFKYIGAKIYGHNEFANKACPVFNVKEFLDKYNLLNYKG